jgi:hypothetical protein
MEPNINIDSVDSNQIKLNLLQELLANKANELKELNGKASRFEDYFSGFKDALQKMETYVRANKKGLVDLRVEGKIGTDVYGFVDNIFDSFFNVIKDLQLENERLALAKKTEITFKTSEIQSLQKIVASTTDSNFTASSDVETKKKERKHRPDKDPTTRIGAAALDLTERKKIKK